ncbi:MAG: hypothetical protein JNJ54_33780 [Myxococcaceae bacterium]|nr:hypothetical protein [Myxococcaceae bacterium]
MVALLLAATLASTPAGSPKRVTLGDVLLVAGEAGLATGGSRPWLGRFSSVVDVPVLGPAGVMFFEAQERREGWQTRFAVSAASLSLQSLGAALLALDVVSPAEDEGAVTTLRPTRIGFRILEGHQGGIVTLSGVTF